MTDHQQIRRDAEAFPEHAAAYAPILARHCLALLDELGQAERDKAAAEVDAAGQRRYADDLIEAAEARLAKVPLLIEALKQGANALDSLLADIANDLPFDQEDYDQGDAARAEIETALAAWEDE
jgi:hypothetical protein